MDTLIATYRIVTPTFLGGAEPTADAELRLPSFKGALRFWWRALMWGHISDIDRLRKTEALLFGSSDSAVGQSKVTLSITGLPRPVPVPLRPGDILGCKGGKTQPRVDVVGEGARYLGYGLMEPFDGRETIGGRLTRSCLASPLEFQARVQFRPGTGDALRTQTINSLKLLGLCGGLGSRSRRGFGSLTLTGLAGMGQSSWAAPGSARVWEESLKAVVGPLPQGNALPEWTSFSAGHTRVLVVRGVQEAPLETLARLGRDFVFFRSWGKNGKVLGLPREGNFKDDHDLMRQRGPQDRKTHPRRIVFGLPHNYGKRADEQVGPADPGLDRRASPLFFHIHQPADQTPPLGILLFLPSRYLPPNRDRVSVGGPSVPLSHQGTGEFWNPVHAFLERVQAGRGKERFAETRLIEL